MDAVQYFQTWVVGETVQGRVMMVVGISLSIATVLIFRSENPLLRGMLIPVIVLVAMNLGYGSVLTSRPATSQKVEATFRQDQERAVEQQITKTAKDERYYASARPTWAILTAISVLLFFIFKDDYYRGLSLGLTAMFFGALLIDSFLHHRLLAYMEGLDGLIR